MKMDLECSPSGHHVQQLSSQAILDDMRVHLLCIVWVVLILSFGQAHVAGECLAKPGCIPMV